MRQLHALYLLVASIASASAGAAERHESVAGDLRGDRLAPATLELAWGGTPGPNGQAGNNVISGSFGRGVDGLVDRDYLHLHVPQGYSLSEIRVGQQATFAGRSAFIGIAAGASMPVDPDAGSAAGLLGWAHFGPTQRQTDVLDEMAVAAAGASGFDRPLPAGSYTLWIQETGTGSFNWRFNLIIIPQPIPPPIPEPATTLLWAAGLGLAAAAARRRRAGAAS